MRIIILCILLSVITAQSYAQSDSFETKEIVLKEVVINPAPGQQNQKQFTPEKNVQTSTDHLLNKIPGVSMIKRGNYAWEPGIRGLSNGQITTTIDGMAIFGACTDRMDPVSSYIEPNNLKSIGISYGASEMSSGNTIGGGLDFKTRQPVFSKKKAVSGMAATGYGSNGNSAHMLASVNYSQNNFAVNVNGIYRSAQSYLAGGGTAVPFSQFSKWNGGLGAKLKLNDHNALLINYIRDEGYDIGYPALTMDVSFAKANIMSLTHQWHLQSGFVNKVESKVYFNTIAHAMDDTKRPAAQVHMHMDMPGISQTMGFLSLASASAGAHSLKLKVNAYQNRLHAEMTMYPEEGSPMFMLTLPEAQRNYYELALQDEWPITKSFVLHSGASFSGARSGIFSEDGKATIAGTLQGDHSRSDLLYAFHASPVYRFGNGLSVFAIAGYSMRLPTLQELFGFYLFNRADNFDYMGNPLLRNERSWNASVGGDIRRDGFKASVKLFSYFMRDYIAGVMQPGIEVMTHGADGIKQYQNLKSATLAGMEAELEGKINAWWSVSSLNSFSYGADKAGAALPMIPPFRTINRMNFSFKGYRLQPEVMVATAQNHVSGFYAETGSPAFAVVNFSADRSVGIGQQKMHITAGVENLLDSKYHEHTDLMKVWRTGRSAFCRLSWYF